MRPDSRRPGRGWEALLVTLLFVVGAGLRMYRLDVGWFGVDQARDIATALDIAAGHDLPTVGPTMHRVISLGALYYYFWALPNLMVREPLASYWFAGLLGLAALVLTWSLARRLWGVKPALVALTVGATFPIAVIDSRVAWAPAALPMAGAVILWLLLGPVRATEGTAPPSTVFSIPRTAVLGAVLGLAIQLHLTMAAWLVAAAALLLIDRLPWSRLAVGALCFVTTGFPAAWVAMTNAGQDAGLTSLPTRGPIPHVADRLGAVYALTWRVPAAFSPSSDTNALRDIVAPGAAVVVSTAITMGLVRLALRAVSDRAARTLVIVVLVQLAVVIGLPGRTGYYYLDALLPLWALAVGVLIAPEAAPGITRRAPTPRGWSPAGTLAAAAVVASLALGLDTADWLVHVARSGYMTVDFAPLNLDAASRREPAMTGRLLSVRVTRAVAATVASEGRPFEALWRSMHGPAFDSVTNDNGFWVRWFATDTGREHPGTVVGAANAQETRSLDSELRHVALWFRDDPAAPSVPSAGFEVLTIGPIVLARYRPSIDYDSCISDGTRIGVPIRVVPHPRRYEDGTRQRSRELPHRIECVVKAGTGWTHVVAAVTEGSVALTDGSLRRGTTGRESALCVRRGAQASSVVIELDLPAGVASDFDLYERPGPACIE